MTNEMLPKVVNSNYARQISTSVWTRIGIITIVTLTGAVWLYIKGPIHVIKGSTPLTEMVPFWYMLLAFPILGMLIADFIALLFTFGLRFEPVELFIQISILVLLSSIRLSSAIPISGHSQLLGYFILRRILINFRVTNIYNTEFLISFLILVAVIFMKLWQWSDSSTLIIGIVIGCAQAVVSYLFWQWIRNSKSVVRSTYTI
jgi:hypothetical protein